MKWIDIKDKLPKMEKGKIASQVCVVWGYDEDEDEMCCFLGRYWAGQGWFTKDNDLPIKDVSCWLLIEEPK